MLEIFVAKLAKYPDGNRRIVRHAGREIGVFHWQSEFHTYANLCLHQGGPAREGAIMHKIEGVIGADRTWQSRWFPNRKSISSAPGTAMHTVSRPANEPLTAARDWKNSGCTA